jgi:hypothetical protein
MRADLRVKRAAVPGVGILHAVHGLTHEDMTILRAGLAAAVANFSREGAAPGADELTRQSCAQLAARAETLYQLITKGV